MDYSLILKNINKHIALDKSEETYFVSLLQAKSIKSKKSILNAGEVCRYSTFVTKGCLRGYTIDKNGFEHVLTFAPVDWWIADMYSLITLNPGVLIIQALEDTEMLLLSKTDQEELYKRIPKFERFFRILSEKSLVAFQQRIVDSLSLSAEERFLKFCKIYPALIHTLPQKQIAAYIGVTPEFLSKMRTRLLKRL